MECPKCRATSSIASEECSSCGLIFAKYEISKSFANQQTYKQNIKALTQGPGLWVELGYPIFIVFIAPILLWMFPTLTWSVSMMIHEFGHAFSAWFGGLAATPFLGWTSYSGQRTWAVTFCFTILLSLLAYKSWEKKSYFLVSTFACMFIVQIYFRFFLNDFELARTNSWMGIGGEFWISAWMMIAFHYELPEEMHWSWMRYFIFLAGAVTFIQVFNLWLNVSQGHREIPWGSLWGSHGDMDALSKEWGWGDEQIVQSYLNLGYACLGVVGFNYIVHVVLKIKRPSISRGPFEVQ